MWFVHCILTVVNYALNCNHAVFVHSCEHDMIELRKRLNLAPLPAREDPRCRFV